MRHRARPHEHRRRLRSGRIIPVNRGVRKIIRHQAKWRMLADSDIKPNIVYGGTSKRIYLGRTGDAEDVNAEYIARNDEDREGDFRTAVAIREQYLKDWKKKNFGASPLNEMHSKDRKAIRHLIVSKPSLETLRDSLDQVNNRIDYGTRKEIITKPSLTLGWSNAQQRWNVYRGYGVLKPETTAKLDANEIVIPTDSTKQAEVIARMLPPLPLYKYSSEAKERGQVDPTMSSLGWAIKQLEARKKEEFQNKNK